jgi:hypothetical protein
MNIRAMVTIAALVGVSACAGEHRPSLERKVTVCMDFDRLEANLARVAASRVFEEIGVSIEWQRYGDSCPVASGAIAINLSYDTPRNRFQGALAYARPYEGTHIVVFYDRVRASVPLAQVRCLLAYVIVHEIAHILQGVKRHSASGIMKAKWGQGDYFAMARKSFRFAEEDVGLIHLGIDWRQSRVTSASARVESELPVMELVEGETLAAGPPARAAYASTPRMRSRVMGKSFMR